MLMRLTCVIIVLLALAVGSYSQYGYNGYNQVQVAPVAVVQPLAITVPAYSVGYTGSAEASPELGGLQKRVAALEARVVTLEQRLAALQPAPPPPPGPNPPPAPGRGGAPDPFAPKPNPQAAQPQAQLPALFARSCIQCHQVGRKQEGGFAVADKDGAMLAFDDAHVKEILRRIILPEGVKGRMPPRKANQEAASPTEIGEVLAVLVAK